MDCIEELHQQLGDTVMDHLQVLPIQPAQLKGLQARFSQLSSNSQIVQDYPLFQAVTTEPEAQQLDSMTSRSDCSSQVRKNKPVWQAKDMCHTHLATHLARVCHLFRNNGRPTLCCQRFSSDSQLPETA